MVGLERQLDRAGVTDLTRCDFWDAVGRLRQAEGRWSEAEAAFRRSLALLDGGVGSPIRHSVTLDVLALGLRDHGRWAEAEPLFRRALELKEEAGDSPASRGRTLSELACGLRDHGRWAEAEPLFHRALELKEQGNDTPISRGMTMEELARGLFAQGQQLRSRGGDTTATLDSEGEPPVSDSAHDRSRELLLEESASVKMLREKLDDLEAYLK